MEEMFIIMVNFIKLLNLGKDIILLRLEIFIIYIKG